MAWDMMSKQPAAVWNGGSVKVSSGLMIAKSKRISRANTQVFRSGSTVSSRQTAAVLTSLPVPGIVTTTPCGRTREAMGAKPGWFQMSPS